MRTHHNILVCPLILFFSFLVIMTCMKDSPTGGKDTDTNGGVGTTITSSGGMVEDHYGASITVPADAVSSNMKISVRTIHADSIPAELQSALVGNMIECLPHGAEFLKPVTIVLPVTSDFTYQPGDTANLYYYNADSSAWEMTDIPAVVTADGRRFQASVTHFSDCGTNTTGGYNGGSHFKDVKNYINLMTQAESWAASFMESMGGLYSKKRVQDCCMYLANAVFNFRFTSASYSGTFKKTYGDQANCDKMETVHLTEGDPDPDGGYSMHVMVQICWVVCDPDMQVGVSPDHFDVPEDKGKTASITAGVSCGDGPGYAFSGKSVKFVILNGPGQVNPPMAQLDGSGTATGTYTVGNRGTASIRAELQTCSSIQPVITMKTTQVVVDTVIADYIDAIINIHHGGGDMPWTFHDFIVIRNYLYVDDQTASITGGDGTQEVTCTATDGDCSIRNISAPGFAASGRITRHENALDVELNPYVPINFTYYCDFGDDDIINEPVPAYAYMVSSIIAQHVKGTLQMETASFLKGSGAESFGEDLPLSFDWELVFSYKTHP